MKATFEITDRFAEPGKADELLYTPLDGAFTYRRTRRYLFAWEGDEITLNRFVAETLVDPVSQTLHAGDGAVFSGFLFALDYGMKPGALDLEKEAILRYHRELADPGFELRELTIRHRIYVFAEHEGDLCSPDRFIRDVCNAAIHQWTTLRG